MSVDRERVEALYRTINESYGRDPREQVDLMRELADPDIELIVPPDYVDFGPVHGYDGLVAWLEMVSKVFETWRYEVLDIRDAGDDRVLVLLELRVRGASSGAEMVVPGGHVLDFRDGRLLRLEVHRSHEAALEAAGLPAS
jgi:ketosteroid isomerase-like protein